MGNDVVLGDDGLLGVVFVVDYLCVKVEME